MNTIREIKVLIKNTTEDIDKYTSEQINTLFKKFDNSTYIKDSIGRSITRLYDVQF